MISKRNQIDRNVQNILNNEEEYNFCVFIQKLREAYSLTQKKVAEELGLNYHQYFYWESGDFYRRWPTDQQLKDLAQYYEVPEKLMIKKLLEVK